MDKNYCYDNYEKIFNLEKQIQQIQQIIALLSKTKQIINSIFEEKISELENQKGNACCHFRTVSEYDNILKITFDVVKQNLYQLKAESFNTLPHSIKKCSCQITELFTQKIIPNKEACKCLHS